MSTGAGEEEGEYHEDEAEHVARGEESPGAGERGDGRLGHGDELAEQTHHGTKTTRD